MPVKKFIRDYLSFNRKERIGILSLLGLISVICFLPGFLRNKKPFPLGEYRIPAKLTDSLNKNPNESPETETPSISSHYEPHSKAGFNERELFYFDPNALTPDGWRSLGLNERTTKTIINYINKGGKFRAPEDLKNIWGMPEGFFERVKPYIRVEASEQKFERREYVKTVKKSYSLDINKSDTTGWIDLPGIGSKLALRIVNFREKLGGFYSIEQVKETFGLHDSVFQKIKPFLQISSEVKKININTASKDELKTHPYIKWNIANAIVEYRNQHGNFKSQDELKNISLIDETSFRKIFPYLDL